MRKAYQLDGFIARGYDGAGQTIVIVDAFQHPNLQAQMNNFDSYYGLPPVQLSQVAPDGLTPFDPADPVMVGWAEEISLDVEWAHAMAPGAKIVLVLAKTSADSDILSAIRYAVDNNLGNVISMSFGANENCVDAATHRAYHHVFAQATRQNMTLLASSADQGAALPSCDGSSWEKAVSSPANDPLVTAVGGTELRAAGFCLPALGCDPATNPAPGTWQSEIVWNEGPKYGDFGNVFAATGATGGGYSSVFDAPKYQKASMRGLKQRAVPDVAYNAAVLHGVLVRLDIPGLPGGWYRFGGTSAGAPQWAALVAIANERAGRPLGFLNAGLYEIGRMPALYSGLFHDIALGNNSAVEFDAAGNPIDVTGYTAGPGWDATTGLGSPSPGSLAELLMQYVAAGDSDEPASIVAKPVGTSNRGANVKPH
ncbi:S53 family peptidase [Ramlibacter sp. MMS24-I3-19]|uniref:S53 family peptidase n=1 Tax=Ramlibacter sp. MMS24-I3-19 TaxID=3416606 RepID=UPI003D04E4F0